MAGIYTMKDMKSMKIPTSRLPLHALQALHGKEQLCEEQDVCPETITRREAGIECSP
jgi:hypothetical protein